MVEAANASAGRGAPHPVAVFVILDIAAFGMFLAIFMVERMADSAAFASGAAGLHANLGWFNTFVLVTSGACVAMAEAAFRSGGNWRRWLTAGLVVGAVFAFVKIYEYAERIGRGVAASDTFTGYYFVLTGLHFAHYLVGMALLVWLLQRRGSASGASLFGAVALYWHMVDLLWLLIFPVIYLQVTP